MRLEHAVHSPHDLLHYTTGFNGRKLKIEVHWDKTYPFQSSADCSVWSNKDMEWHNVCHLLPHEVIDLNETEQLLLSVAGAVLFDPEQDGED